MKGHKKHKAEGGAAKGSEEGFGKPRDDWKEEENSKPKNYGSETNVSKESEEKKRGGRAKRKHGGGIHKHHEKGEHMKHAKHIGHVDGKAKHHAGRAPRKSGGRAGSNFSPLSSAHAGSSPKGHKTVDID